VTNSSFERKVQPQTNETYKPLGAGLGIAGVRAAVAAMTAVFEETSSCLLFSFAKGMSL